MAQDRVIMIEGGGSIGIPLDLISEKIIAIIEDADCEYGPEAKNRLIIGYNPGPFFMLNKFEEAVEDMRGWQFLTQCKLGQSNFSGIVLLLPKVWSFGDIVIADLKKLDDLRCSYERKVYARNEKQVA